MTNAETGCFKSHFAVLSTFQTFPKLQWLLVLEDDVRIDIGFPFPEILKLLRNRNIEYLRLFAREYKRADVIHKLGERQLIRFRTDPYGTQAYLISRTGAERFMRTLSSIDMPINDEFGRFWIHGLGIYPIFPFSVVERAGISSIQGERNMVSTSTALPMRHLNRVVDWVAKAKENLRYRFAVR